MYCKIADLIVDVPAADGLDRRCQDYVTNEVGSADMVIRTDLYNQEKYHPQIDRELFAYFESGRQFCAYLIKFSGFYLHASAVVKDGKAYLFSGPCGAGKSTHTRLWQQVFGEEAVVINDDKPALRRIDGKWYAYGTPWCGKEGINCNQMAPLAGVCFLKQGPVNEIRSLSKFEALQRVLGQTIYKFDEVSQLDQLLASLELFLDEIPVYELENRPEAEAVWLSFQTMSQEPKGVEDED